MACSNCDPQLPVVIIEDRLPVAGDDPCGTSGVTVCNGQMVYSVFNDPNTCNRLFIRTSETCNTMAFLEFLINECVSRTVDPVDGVDCCAPNTLWHNTVSNAYFMSLNCDGTCTWTSLAATVADPENVQDIATQAEIDFLTLGTIPVATVNNIGLTTLTVNNPSATRGMNFYINWTAPDGSIALSTTNPDLTLAYSIQPTYRLNAVVQNNPLRTDATWHWVTLDTGTMHLDIPLRGWQAITTVAGGGSVTADFDVTIKVDIPHDANTTGFLTTGGGQVAIIGNAI